MKVHQLADDASIMETLRKFCLDPNFIRIKDAFISSTPNGGNESTQIIHNSGRTGGTIYVFNEIENLVKSKPKPEPKKSLGQDPDLKTD